MDCIVDCVEYPRTPASCWLACSFGVLSSTTLRIIVEQTNHIGAKDPKKSEKSPATLSTYSHCSIVPAERHEFMTVTQNLQMCT